MGKTECAAAPVNAPPLPHNLPPSPAAPPSPSFAHSPERPPPDVPVSAWLPADLDAHIPAHIIATNLPRVRASTEDTLERDFNPTPLDNLLAVAELEFNQQQAIKHEQNFTLDLESNASNLHQHLSKFTFLTEEDCDRADMSFVMHNAIKQDDNNDMFFSEKVPENIEETSTYPPNMVVSKDLFESITEAHYLPDLANHPDESINANEFLDSLVEKGCEDHIIGNAFEKLAHLVNHASDLHEEYANREHPISPLHGAHDDDILLSRFEQSLDSPSQNSITAAQGLLHLQQMSEQLAKEHMLTVSDTDQYNAREYNTPPVAVSTGDNDELQDVDELSDRNLLGSVENIKQSQLDVENVHSFVSDSDNANSEPNNNEPISDLDQINTLNINLCETEVLSTNPEESTRPEFTKSIDEKLGLGEVSNYLDDLQINNVLAGGLEKENDESDISHENVHIMKVPSELNSDDLTVKQTTEALLKLAQRGVVAEVVKNNKSIENTLQLEPSSSESEVVDEIDDNSVVESNIEPEIETHTGTETESKIDIEAGIETDEEIGAGNGSEVTSEINEESSNTTGIEPVLTTDTESSPEPESYSRLQKEMEEVTIHESNVDNDDEESSKPIDRTERTDDDKNEDLPKDLSCHKRAATPYTSPTQLESFRPHSCSSSQQSPHRNGPSPNISLDAFTISPITTSASKSLFLETLLASPPAKMCLNSEVTITKTQHEPLNLERTRKSASPVVTITAEECRKIPSNQTTEKDYGEPEEKKSRKETSDELALARLNKVLYRSTDMAAESKQKRGSERSSSKCSDRQSPKNTERTTPLKQFQLMRLKPEGVPDPLIMPKEKLTAVLSSPAKEIPSLISQRPDLLVYDELAYSAILQDPNMLVISLTQLEDILTKQEKILEQLTGKPYLDLNDIKTLSPSDIAKSIQRAQVGMEWARQLPSLESLAGDIDAATTAALNQMIWLPYLSHLEAAALSCQSSELLKAFTSTSALPPYTPQNAYPDLSQMLSVQPRFLGPGAIPIMHQMEYNNQLEMAMWQEAMAQANTLNVQHQRAVKQASANDHNLTKNAENQNHYQLSAKSQQNRSQSSARTSPITRNYNGCQRASNHTYYANACPNYNGNSRTNVQATALQVPHYTPPAPPHQASQRHQQQHKTSNAHQHSYYHNNNYLASLKQAANSTLSPTQKRGLMHGNGHGFVNAHVNGPLSMHATGHANMYPNGAGNTHMNGNTHGGAESNGRERGPGRPSSHSSSNSQSPHDESRPRISVKSLHNLLEPSAQQQHTKSHVRPDPYVPMYHSPSMSELMAKPSVPQGPTRRQAAEAASLQRRMLGHEEEANASAMPEELAHGQMHDAQTHLWHPLFGNQKNYNSPWNWTQVTATGE